MKYTYSTLFLFPLLGIPHELFKCFLYNRTDYLNTRYINTYLGDDTADIPENALCVVHLNIMDKDFTFFEDTLEALPTFKLSYDILDTHFGVKVMDIPDAYQEDYQKFLQGQYSQYSDKAQRACINGLPPNFIGGSAMLQGIFEKTDEYKEKLKDKVGDRPYKDNVVKYDQEVWSLYQPEKETLNPNTREMLQQVIVKYGNSARLVNRSLLEEDSRKGMGSETSNIITE